MKKVFVVSKTHLDLGFTDYAESIRRKYIDTFIPEAIELAEKVNTDGKKYFIWTTGSWIIKEALKDEKCKAKLEKALREGNIVPQAMPFTTHTELLDEDSLDFGLSIVDALDEMRGHFSKGRNRPSLGPKWPYTPDGITFNARSNQARLFSCEYSGYLLIVSLLMPDSQKYDQEFGSHCQPWRSYRRGECYLCKAR